MLHDVFGAVVRSTGARYDFICNVCGQRYAILDKRGLKVLPHNKQCFKQRDGGNRTSLKALEQIIKEIKR